MTEVSEIQSAPKVFELRLAGVLPWLIVVVLGLAVVRLLALETKVTELQAEVAALKTVSHP